MQDVRFRGGNSREAIEGGICGGGKRWEGNKSVLLRVKYIIDLKF